MYQIHRILFFAVMVQWVATPNVVFDHLLDRVSSGKFVYSLMYFSCHLTSVFLPGSIGTRTYFFYRLVFIYNIQAITPVI